MNTPSTLPEPIRRALPVVSPLSETAHPTTDPESLTGGTVYHDMTPAARALILLTRVLYVLGLASTYGATWAGMLPASWRPLAAFALALLPALEWLIRVVCDWLDNGAMDHSYPAKS
ncbi:hypothetical protein DB346_07480 [Verrucomicrobia bacterium LW23]|nr:hypothetical protein DB346_07480 [Verrucomicrobia bacterium LW23]